MKENEFKSSITFYDFNKENQLDIENRKNKNTSFNFIERQLDLNKLAKKNISKIKSLEDTYKNIPSYWSEKKSDIVRKLNIFFNLSLEERNSYKKKEESDFNYFKRNVENDTSLTENEKNELIEDRKKELDETFLNLDECAKLNDFELNNKIENEFKIIDRVILEERKTILNNMLHIIEMSIKLINRSYLKGAKPDDIYEALKVLAVIELEDKTLEKKLRIKFDEILTKSDDLKKIYISYSEKETYEDNLSYDSYSIDLINELLDKAEKELDIESLNKARDMVLNLPEGNIKDELEKKIEEIDKLINKKNNLTDIDLINELLDKAEKELDIESLNKARDMVLDLPEGNIKDELEKKIEEIDKLINNKKNDEEPQMPIIEKNDPKKTWKTWAMLAAGIGVGSAVFFTCGTLGVSVMAISGGIAKRLVSKRRKKLAIQRLKGEMPVEEVIEPKTFIKKQIYNLKKYFKSEEFCRDATWFLNGAIYTGLTLNVASSISNLIEAKHNIVSTKTTIEPHVESNISNTVSNPTDGIKIGENVGNYNVSVGHDTASFATSKINAEELLSQYVNKDSIFKSFRVVNPDGSLGQAINTNGLSITDFCNSSGIDPSNIAVDVASKDGISQAWVSVEELLKGVGGKKL